MSANVAPNAPLIVNLIPCPRFVDVLRQGRNTYNLRYDVELSNDEFFALALQYAELLDGDYMAQFAFDQFDYDSARFNAVRVLGQDVTRLNRLRDHYERTNIVNDGLVKWTTRFTAVASLFYFSSLWIAFENRRFTPVKGFDPTSEIDPEVSKEQLRVAP